MRPSCSIITRIFSDSLCNLNNSCMLVTEYGLAYASEEGRIFLWNIDLKNFQNRSFYEILYKHKNKVTEMGAMSNILISVSIDYTACLFDLLNFYYNIFFVGTDNGLILIIDEFYNPLASLIGHKFNILFVKILSNIYSKPNIVV
ncbi:hypothetical protein HZS_1546 [Henneguya salminicola]|nr:hypothetical protein HZS_1546 [Henneguya salminicola]